MLHDHFFLFFLFMGIARHFDKFIDKTIKRRYKYVQKHLHIDAQKSGYSKRNNFINY